MALRAPDSAKLGAFYFNNAPTIGGRGAAVKFTIIARIYAQSQLNRAIAYKLTYGGGDLSRNLCKKLE